MEKRQNEINYLQHEHNNEILKDTHQDIDNLAIMLA